MKGSSKRKKKTRQNFYLCRNFYKERKRTENMIGYVINILLIFIYIINYVKNLIDYIYVKFYT